MGNKRSYIKEIEIKVDKKEVDMLQKQLDSLYVDTLKNKLNDEEYKPASERDLDKIKQLSDMLNELSRSASSMSDTQTIRALFKQGALSAFKNISDAISSFLKDVFDEAKERVLDMATYDLSNSLITNSAAREQALQYGIMDPAQNYALSQTMNQLGMSSQEDLMFMNDKQQEKFAERMGYWSGKYTELANKDFFNTMQRFSIEFDEFKTDFQLDFIEFFIQNKDTLINFMELGMQFMKFITTAIGSLLKYIGSPRTDGARTALTNDIIRQYSTSNAQTNVNINNNLYPGSQTLTDKEMLNNAGKVSYAQVIEALKG
jgi:hypothetical protein